MYKSKKFFYVSPNSVNFFINEVWLLRNKFNFFPFSRSCLHLTCVNSDSHIGFIIGKFLFFTIFNKKNLLILIIFFSKFSNFLNHLIFTLTKQIKKAIIISSFGFYNVIQFVGFRYRQRWIRSGQVLRYRIGYNKKVWFKCPFDFVALIRKISPKKRTHFMFSYQFKLLRNLTLLIYNARPGTIYKGRGINLKERPMELKEGKKTNW